MQKYPLVSVFTCVYNGERTINRVFESMKTLDYPNIEHIIVNDGSTDGTEQLIAQYIEQVSFPVKYHKKENGGKHTAMNVAWDLAEGEFIIGLDADDELLPHAITYLVDTYYQIPEDIRQEYWCVHGRWVTQHGVFVGDKYPDHINEHCWQEAGAIASKCKGDKMGLKVRKYLDPYRFPNVRGVSHIPEAIVWQQINKKYGTWYTNEVGGIYYVGEGGNLTDIKTKRKQFSSTCYRFKWRLIHPELFANPLKNALIYSVLYFIADDRFRKHNGYLADIKKCRFALILFCPFSFLGAFAIRTLKKIR